MAVRKAAMKFPAPSVSRSFASRPRAHSGVERIVAVCLLILPLVGCWSRSAVPVNSTSAPQASQRAVSANSAQTESSHRAAGAGAGAPKELHLRARVVAVGLPAVAGVRQVGRFHTGGPIPANPEFLLRTESGHVLDAQRLLVATASNYGAGKASADRAEGSVLSIETKHAKTLVIPRDFAAAGARAGQASALEGAVQVYTAQAPSFANRRHNPKAGTAGHTAAAGPRYISVNNAFGRPWIANAPAGPGGAERRIAG
jgi:hypothetical protein